MKFRVVFHSEARREATDAARYIARQSSLDVALRWFDGLSECLDSLAHSPRRFGFAREHGQMPEWELRQTIFKSHRIIFRVDGDSVQVLRVRHVAQDTLDPSDLTLPESDRSA